MKKKIQAASSRVSGVLSFFRVGIWQLRLRDLSPTRQFFVKYARILLIAGREFVDDRCPLRSSALTFYSILSIVPVMALAFAVAKGFGLQHMLEKELLAQFAGQEEVILKVIEYARTLLDQTRGGLLAGVGAAALVWAVIKVLNNIEQSFNDIWDNTSARSLGKKFSDYLSVMLVAPLLMILSGSATVLVMTQVTAIMEKVFFLGWFAPVLMTGMELLPYVFIWLLFSFVYAFMPNLRVSVASSLFGGIVAGTAFKVLQWAYLFFQVGVSRYNAIYGSFAALPLFLIWMHLSWLVVLFGAELSFAHQNVDRYELAPDSRNISGFLRRVFGLYVMHLLVKNFKKGDAPLTAGQISDKLDLPVVLVKKSLDALFASGLATPTPAAKSLEPAWQPGRDIADITIASVAEAMDRKGTTEMPIASTPALARLSDAVNAFYGDIQKSRANVALKDI
ncbi:MAG: YihY/virulence factor BrkB family protein [Thermodesulfobacteriota bacterium]